MILAVVVGLASPRWHIGVYDLAANGSNSLNPNGVQSLYERPGVLVVTKHSEKRRGVDRRQISGRSLEAIASHLDTVTSVRTPAQLETREWHLLCDVDQHNGRKPWIRA